MLRLPPPQVKDNSTSLVEKAHIHEAELTLDSGVQVRAWLRSELLHSDGEGGRRRNASQPNSYGLVPASPGRNSRLHQLRVPGFESPIAATPGASFPHQSYHRALHPAVLLLLLLLLLPATTACASGRCAAVFGAQHRPHPGHHDQSVPAAAHIGLTGGSAVRAWGCVRALGKHAGRGSRPCAADMHC